MLVNFPPHGSTPPHRHGGASVVGYVVQGSLLNKMNDAPVKVLNKGETWYEAPGCHHKVSDNNSETEPATLLATFVVDTKAVEAGGYGALVQVDEEYKDVTFPSETASRI
jgi:quercetin dioxygenase-like cupin family protein